MPPGSQRIPGVSSHGMPRRRGPANAPRYFRKNIPAYRPYLGVENAVLSFTEDGRPLPATTLYPSSTALFPAGDYVGKQTNKGNGIDYLPILSFAGAVIAPITHVLASILSFAGVTNRAIFRILMATQSFTTIFAWQLSIFFTAVLSFTGSAAKLVTRLISGALSFIGNTTKQSTIFLTGALAFTGVFVFTCIKVLTAILFLNEASWPSVNLYPSSGNYPIASSPLTRNILKGAGGDFAPLLGFTGNLLRSITQIFTAGVSLIGTLAKSSSHQLVGGAISFAGLISRAILRNTRLTGTLALVGSIRRATTYRVTSVIDFTTTSIIGSSLFIDAFLDLTTSFGKTTLRTLVGATLTLAGMMTKTLKRLLSATMSLIGSFLRGRLFIAILFLNEASWPSGNLYPSSGNYPVGSDSLFKQLGRVFTATTGFTAAILNLTAIPLSAILTWVGVFTHLPTKLFAAILSFGLSSIYPSSSLYPSGTLEPVDSDDLIKTLLRTLSAATLNLTTIFIANPYVFFSALLSFAGAQTKTIYKVMTATLVIVGSLMKLLFRRLTAATLDFIGQLKHTFGFLLTATMTFITAQTRQTNVALQATETFISDAVRFITYSVVSVLPLRGLFLRGRGFNGVITATGQISKRAGVALGGVLDIQGVIQRFVHHLFRLASTLLLTGRVDKLIPRSFKAVLSMTGVIVRKTNAIVDTVIVLTGHLGRFTLAKLASVMAFTGIMLRRARLAFRGALGTSGTLLLRGILYLRSILDTSGQLRRSVRRQLLGVLTFVGYRSVGRFFRAALTFNTRITRITQKRLKASLTLVGTMAQSIKRVMGHIYRMVRPSKLFKVVTTPQVVIDSDVPVTTSIDKIYQPNGLTYLVISDNTVLNQLKDRQLALIKGAVTTDIEGDNLDILSDPEIVFDDPGPIVADLPDWQFDLDHGLPLTPSVDLSPSSQIDPAVAGGLDTIQANPEGDNVID